MKKLKNKLTPHLAGVFVSTPHGGSEIDGPLEVAFAGLLGALMGFIVGLVIGVFTRIATMNSPRGSIGGINWAAWGAGAGAMALAVIELLD